MNVAYGMPFIAIPTIVSISRSLFSSSSNKTSHKASEIADILDGYAPIERQPIFTSPSGFFSLPLFKSHTAVSLDTFSSSAIS